MAVHGLTLGLVAACAVPEPTLPGEREPVTPDTGMVDATLELPPPEDGVTRIETPDIILEPYGETIVCYVGQFPDDADRLAISWASMHEHPVYGHHIQFNGLRREGSNPCGREVNSSIVRTRPRRCRLDEHPEHEPTL